MKTTLAFIKSLAIIVAFNFIPASCSPSTDVVDPNPTPPVPPPTNEVDFWLTKSNQSVLLQKQSNVLYFANPVNMYPSIEIDENISYQSVEGFGYTLTGGSAQVINQ